VHGAGTPLVQAAHWLTHIGEDWRTPLTKAFGALDAEKQAALTGELLELIERGNRSRDRSCVLPSEYLEVVIERQ
jgi:hypothetical protein